MAPGYLSTLCQPVSSVPGRRQLRLARRDELDFPRVNLATYGGRAFAYAGSTSWNSQPDSLKDINLTLQTFKRHLKTQDLLIFHIIHFSSAFEISYKNALYKYTVTVIVSKTWRRLLLCLLVPNPVVVAVLRDRPYLLLCLYHMLVRLSKYLDHIKQKFIYYYYFASRVQSSLTLFND